MAGQAEEGTKGRGRCASGMNGRRKTKPMGRHRDPIREADRKLQEEGERQVQLIYSSAALALWRNWGWRKDRIRRLFELSQDIWEECAKDIDHSMIEMCEAETGIEIQNGSGKSWRDLHYLNSKVNPGRMTPAKWIYMRRKQMEWMAPQVVAGIMLALHRKYSFGYDRCARVYAQINAVERECGMDHKRAIEACRKETSINIYKIYGSEKEEHK